MAPGIPQGYNSVLSVHDTERAIKYVKDTFEKIFSESMNLERVSAPLFVEKMSGLNDNLNGVERPVSFNIFGVDDDIEIVHSLAKWKRLALKRYGMGMHEGLYTDMNAIRKDEKVDNLHSIYVDQWDWEKVISREDRNIDYLKDTVRTLVRALAATELAACAMFKKLTPRINPDVYFITALELEEMYPELSRKERENVITKQYKTVFLMGIGDRLKDGEPHDGRAPDYDDWTLNGDILVWNEVLGTALEISSMGIRVDEKSMMEQLIKADCIERKDLPFHSRLLRGDLPLTIGGGLGQSRICMQLLGKCHIGEVQASVWPGDMRMECENNGIMLL